jgi:hypothetical protein
MVYYDFALRMAWECKGFSLRWKQSVALGLLFEIELLYCVLGGSTLAAVRCGTAELVVPK